MSAVYTNFARNINAALSYGQTEKTKYHTEFNRRDTIPQNYYGVTREQAEMLGGVRMHGRGLTGRGITIAVPDGGFMNAGLIPCLQRTSIEGCGDFVAPKPKSIFKETDHGAKVFSAMAVKEPDTLVDTAPTPHTG